MRDAAVKSAASAMRKARRLGDLPLARTSLPDHIGWTEATAYFGANIGVRGILLEGHAGAVPEILCPQDCGAGAASGLPPLTYLRDKLGAAYPLTADMRLLYAAKILLRQDGSRFGRPLLVQEEDGRYGLLDPLVLLLAISENAMVTERSHRDLLLEVQRYASELEETITARDQIQAQLVQSRKMEAMSSLAGGLAHELNTPAQVIKSNLDFLYEAFLSLQLTIQGLTDAIGAAGSPSLQETAANVMQEADAAFYLDEIQPGLKQSGRAIIDIQQIVGAIGAMAKQDVMPPGPIALGVLLQSAATLAKARWNPNARVDLALQAEGLELIGHEEDVRQAVLALLANALEATEGQDDPRVTIRAHGDHRSVAIEILDNGPGVPQAIRERIFDPFFTTKAPGAGTGMGLALASQVIARYGGRLDCFDRGQGGCFRITFPSASHAALPSAAA